MTSANPISLPPSDPIGNVKAAITDWTPLYADLEAHRPGTDGWVSARCPFHDDRTPSFSFNREHGGFRCHAGCGDGSPFDYVMKRHSVSLIEAVHRIESIFGLSLSHCAGWGEMAYEYQDEDGRPLFRVVRKFDASRARKVYLQCRPDGQGGWAWNVKGVRRVLYRLPDLTARPTEPVFVVEGEKCADRLHRERRLATTAPGGADAKWLPEYSATLKNRAVVILPDNDEPGQAHGQKVAQALRGIAASVRVVALPGLPAKGDIVEWLGAGNTVADLDALVAETPEWGLEDDQPDGCALSLPVKDGVTFLAQDLGSARYVVDRIIPVGGCGFMVSAPKKFKSWLALDLLFSVATGTPWLGHATGDPADVLLIDAESIPQRLQDRIRLVAQARDADAEAIRRLKVLSPGRLLLSDPGQMHLFTAVLRELRPVLTVLDCFARFHALDENSAKDMAPFLGNLRDAANKAGSALLIVHHRGKTNVGGEPSGRLLRGSSDLHGWYDFAAFVDRTGDTAKLSFECRYGEAPDLVVATLQIDGQGAQFLLGEPSLSPEERVLAALTNRPEGCVIKELAELIGFSNGRTKQLAEQLGAQGRVRCAEEKRAGTGRLATVIRRCTDPENTVSPSVSPTISEGTP